MRTLRILLLCCLSTPATLWAGFSDYGVPAATKWYFHADLTAMRTTAAGRHVYGWLEDEVFAEVQAEIGIDVGKEVDRLTAFAVSRDMLSVVVEGDFSQPTQDKLLALGAASGGMDKYSVGKLDYYFVKGDAEPDADDDNPLRGGAWFSFAIDGRLLVASSEAELKRLLAARGRLDAVEGQRGSLLVISAENSLMQAGLDTREFEAEIGWDSNLVRNTEQVALLVADDGGKLAFEVQLLASEAEIASSLASIVRGLISLQVFNDDLDPELSELLQSTTVNVDGKRLSVKVALDPASVIAAIE